MDTGRSEEFIGTGQAARVLEVSTTAVRNFVASGKLRAIKTDDNRAIFVKADVEKLAAERAKR
ncbi:MAG: hypothetical protein ACLQO1_01720 [Steroidobacteraceae bacterium]